MTPRIWVPILCLGMASCAVSGDGYGDLGDDDTADREAGEICGDHIDNDYDTQADEGCELGLTDLGDVLSCGIQRNFEHATDPFYERDRIRCFLSPDVAMLPQVVDLDRLHIKLQFADGDDLPSEFIELERHDAADGKLFEATFKASEGRYPLTLTTQMGVEILEQKTGSSNALETSGANTQALTLSVSDTMLRPEFEFEDGDEHDPYLFHRLPFNLWNVQLSAADDLAAGFPETFNQLLVTFDYELGVDPAESGWSTQEVDTRVSPRASIRLSSRFKDLSVLADMRLAVPVPLDAIWQWQPRLSVSVNRGEEPVVTKLDAPGAYEINTASELTHLASE